MNFKKDQLVFKILRRSRKYIPFSNLFYFLLVAIKLIGIIIISHGYSKNSEDNFTIKNIFKYMCIYNNLEKTNNFFITYYSHICIFLYIVSIIPYAVFLIIYTYHKKIGKQKLDKFSKLIIELTGLLFGLISFFFQHIIEIFVFIILSTFTGGSIDTKMNQNLNQKVSVVLQNFNDNLIVNKFFS